MKRLVIALIALLCAVPASAAISRVGSCAAQATSCTFSVAPSAGDAIVVFAHADGVTTPPTPPTIALTSPSATGSRYAMVNQGGANVNAAIIAVHISDGTETTTGTWTGATSVAAIIYRGANVAPLGQVASGSGASSTLSYSGLTLNKTDGSSWVVAFGAHRSADTTVASTAVTGFTNVANAVDIVAMDTNAGVSSYTTKTQAVAGTSSGWRTATVELLAQTGEDTTKLYVDDYWHMNTVDANPSTLTAAILTSGTDGADKSYGCTASQTNFTINSHEINAAASIMVRSSSTTYAIGSTTRGLFYDNVTAFISCNSTGMWSTRKRGALSVAGYVYFGVPNQGTSSKLYDIWRVENGDGNFCVMQLDSGQGIASGGYAVNVESNPAGTTRHSAYIVLTPATRYWVTMTCNYQKGEAKLSVFNTSGVQVGATVTGSLQYTPSDMANGAYIDGIKVGNQEIGTSGGNLTKFEHMMLDYSAALFPLGPAAAGGGGGGGGATCSPKISILGVSGCLSQTPLFPITPSTGAK